MMDLVKLWEGKEYMPIISVDFSSGRVLMLGQMNKEAFAYTLKTKKVWYYYPEDDEVKMKGEKSGHIQKLVSLSASNDYSSLLAVVEQVGFVCKDDGGHSTCFYHQIYNHGGTSVAKRRKFGKVEIDKNFDYSSEDYE